MDMLVHLRLWRIHTLRPFCFRPSLPLNRSTTLASSNAPTQASPPNTRYAVQYLVQSCGLSSDEALKASQRFPGLIKSSNKPDAVLCFLRETGVSELDIRTAVSRDARILHSHVKKNWKPNIAKLQELRFSIEDISGIIARNPFIFRFNIVSKIDFWMGVLGSVENLSVILKARGVALINSSLEKVIMPNLSFLLENCGFSTRQIVQVINQSPRLISTKSEYVKGVVERVDELGIDRSSVSFPQALIAVSCVSQHTIDAKLNNLRNIGFSQEEVALLISKFPSLLTKAEKSVARKMEFLMKEAGCDKLHVIQNPFLFCCNLENRLIPRNIVRKLLLSKGLPVANLKFTTFARPSDENFVEKFVLPYEHVIPGLHRAFADAGRTEGPNGILPGIMRDVQVDPMPPLLRDMIRHLVSWQILSKTCVLDSCIINIYNEGNCNPPHIDHNDFLLPFCTVSFLSYVRILFGRNLKVFGPGKFSGCTAISLRCGSVIVLSGNGAEEAKHCVPAVRSRRKMDPEKLPYQHRPDPDFNFI